MMILPVQSIFRVLTRTYLLVLDEINDILFYSILFKLFVGFLPTKNSILYDK
jgi:hypothetical protein